jgi:hypothetical protein
MKPKNGECVIWIWKDAGQVTAGDYFNGKPRDAAKNYEEIQSPLPSHWIRWDKTFNASIFFLKDEA